jgi:O-antigen ligase
MLHGAVYAVLGLCAWGVLAFGGVYPWAYWPLAAGSAAVAALLMLDARVRARMRGAPPLALAALFAAIGLQLIPLPTAVLEILSPATTEFLNQYVLGFSIAPSAHALSILPGATATALALGIAFAALLLALAALLTEIGSRRLVGGLVALGVLVALIGIIQRPFFDGRIYGFWEPIGRNNSFGPFVNPNHFAGWMTMCLSLTLGWLAGRFATSMRYSARSWRDYIAWASAPEANGLALLMTAAATMGLALVLALSRSGLLCFAVAVGLTMIVTLRKQQGARRGLTVASLLAVGIGVMAWAGPSMVASEFRKSDWRQFGLAGRLEHWKDGMSVARAFPIAGSGLNTYGTAMLHYQRDKLAPHTTAAHNEYVHVLAEGGLLVAIPVVAAIVVMAGTIRRRFREEATHGDTYWIRVGAVTGLVAIALQSFIDFSLQMPGNAVLFACLCAIAIHRAPALAPRRSK